MRSSAVGLSLLLESEEAPFALNASISYSSIAATANCVLSFCRLCSLVKKKVEGNLKGIVVSVKEEAVDEVVSFRKKREVDDDEGGGVDRDTDNADRVRRPII